MNTNANHALTSACGLLQLIIRIWRVEPKSTPVALLEWDVDFRAMRYLCKKMSVAQSLFPAGTLLFAARDGYYTAPDIAARVHCEEEPAIKPNVSTVQRKSYDFIKAVGLLEKHREICRVQDQIAKLVETIQEKLAKDGPLMEKTRLKGERQSRTIQLQARLQACSTHVERARHELDALSDRASAKRTAIQTYGQRLRDNVLLYEQLSTELTTTRALLKYTNEDVQRLERRRLSTMRLIYPIEQASTISSIFTICDTRLPNSMFADCKPEVVATALGYTCHLANMIAYYLRVPVKFPMVAMCSRSYVIDPLAIDPSQSTYPLYAKGQDVARYEYGVFLLNKNIEQLLISQGLSVIDIRNTLPNLRWLLDTIKDRQCRADR
ncbi:UV radiation resistance protein and autophagy-related subunit 14-domain-containing protein [Thamnocephalis sphaerospora]|uniref:UV radiation resistance protein and autophagy-related subunit 14-domain-containing protein n=1 Tax=Thamnocephalis sphaerospora TaxID=78915 RepID=A0A4P9XVZ9_9FUNG|nr:UV radiation resistance protein and autophagy-related subunit 14-domain-containing protein [Thamnocephalis sphaerospora]|eukprot:RKP10474.1 UV radiation resistance protein and autophagy-related subunit 14-domain-containing protein [Thamnocephalis sphaerospora]